MDYQSLDALLEEHAKRLAKKLLDPQNTPGLLVEAEIRQAKALEDIAETLSKIDPGELGELIHNLVVSGHPG